MSGSDRLVGRSQNGLGFFRAEVLLAEAGNGSTTVQEDTSHGWLRKAALQGCRGDQRLRLDDDTAVIGEDDHARGVTLTGKQIYMVAALCAHLRVGEESAQNQLECATQSFIWR